VIAGKPDRRGVTLIEVMVSCFLTALLAYIVSNTWKAFDRAATGVIARCELVREADLALAYLADDLRGLASSRPSSRGIVVDSDGLHLIFQDRTILFAVQSDGRLLRTDSASAEPPRSSPGMRRP